MITLRIEIEGAKVCEIERTGHDDPLIAEITRQRDDYADQVAKLREMREIDAAETLQVLTTLKAERDNLRTGIRRGVHDKQQLDRDAQKYRSEREKLTPPSDPAKIAAWLADTLATVFQGVTIWVPSGHHERRGDGCTVLRPCIISGIYLSAQPNEGGVA